MTALLSPKMSRFCKSRNAKISIFDYLPLGRCANPSCGRTSKHLVLNGVLLKANMPNGSVTFMTAGGK
jgi:hypothetical protein